MKKSTLQLKIAQLPQNPGVYFFCDQKDEILYIGKATNLRSRVSSYFRNVIPNLFRDLDAESSSARQIIELLFRANFDIMIFISMIFGLLDKKRAWN